jgi:hypothetical protein
MDVMAWTDWASGRRLMAAIGLTGAMLLGGCAYDDGYGYDGVNVGAGYYGGGGYYDDYAGYGGNYYRPGYGGWYNDFYYPGSGYYVYDRGGKRHRWNDRQRSYWENRHRDGNGGGRWNNGRPGNDGRPNDGRPNAGQQGDWRNNRMITPPQQQGRPWRGPRPDGVTEGSQRQGGSQPGWRGNRNQGGATSGARPSAQSQEWRSNRMITPPQQQGRPSRNTRNPRN